MPTAPKSTFDLSASEHRLLAELVAESPSKMIAQQLEISEASLYRRVSLLRRKLGVTGRTEAGIWAVKKAL